MPDDAEITQHDGPRLPKRLLRVGATISVLAALTALGARAWVRHRSPSAERYAYEPSPAGELPQLWSLPGFSTVDHRGAELSRESLRGRPFIASFIFTQCTNVCPAMTSRVVQLQRRLAGRRDAGPALEARPRLRIRGRADLFLDADRHKRRESIGQRGNDDPDERGDDHDARRRESGDPPARLALLLAVAG